MNPAEHANRYDWQNAIMETDFPATTKYVLLALSCYMNPKGERGFPSTKMLAESAGLSERCVITHLKAGKKAGLFVIVKHRVKGKDWARHEYIPILPKDYKAKSDSITPKNGTPNARYGTEPRSAPSENLTLETHQGTEPRSAPNEGWAKTGEGTEPRSAARGYGTEPDDTMALNEVQSSNTSYLKTNTTRNPPYIPPVDEPKKSRLGFEQFWKAYPKKRSKGQAEKAWAKIKPSGPLVETMLESIERAKSSLDWRKEGGRFIPYPASWLNAKGWDDEIDVEIESDTQAGNRHETGQRPPKSRENYPARIAREERDYLRKCGDWTERDEQAYQRRYGAPEARGTVIEGRFARL